MNFLSCTVKEFNFSANLKLISDWNI